MAVLFALITRHSKKSIYIGVFPATLMLYLEVELLELLQPPGQLSFRISEVVKPGQVSMVSPELETSTKEVGSEMPSKMHNSK